MVNLEPFAKSLGSSTIPKCRNSGPVRVTRIFAGKPYLVIAWSLGLVIIQREIGHEGAHLYFASRIDVRDRAEQQVAIPHFHLVALVLQSLQVRITTDQF